MAMITIRLAYDSPSLEVAYAENMQKNIPHNYAPHISPITAYFFAYFPSKSSAYFTKILRYEPASLGLIMWRREAIKKKKKIPHRQLGPLRGSSSSWRHFEPARAKPN